MAQSPADSGNVPETIMNIVWKLLWTPGTPFYLPSLIANGSPDGGPIAPLGDRSVQDLGPFALFDQKPWGTVSISLSNSKLGGLQTVSDGGFTFNSQTSSFTAALNFQSLRYAGSYAVDGSGLAGCAVAGLTGLLGLFPGGGSRLAATGGSEFDNEHLVLARDYQAQLVNSPAGLGLVSNYYDNNDAMNEIVRGQTYFNHAFPTILTAGKTSKDYADQTTAAAKAPNDPANTVGDANYRLHAFRMQVVFAKSAEDLYKQTGDPKYTEAGTAKDHFAATVEASGITGPNTVGQVMGAVQSAPRESLRAVRATPVVLPPEYVAALAEMDADHLKWSAANTSRPFSQLQAMAAMNLGSGYFEDTFSVPSLKIEGTVTVTGQLPKVSLVVTLTKITAAIPRINITISTSLPNTLYQAVVSALANADFVKDLMSTKVNEALASQDVLTFLSKVINDAIASVTQAP
jgi:hypothetical protein